jgi:putative oxidoreductase
MPSTDRTTPYAALLLRLGLGATLLAHGFVLKIMTFGLAGTMGFFGSIGYPPLLGAVVAIGEVVAGIALILGLRVRLASLLSLPILLGATWQHAGNGWLFTAPGGGWEFPAFLALALLVQAGLGAGAHALEGRLGSAAGRPATAHG